MVRGCPNGELTRIMGEAHEGINFATQPPAIVLMAGLQGGKDHDTSESWPAKGKPKKKVLVVSRRRRPAAIEQLKSVAGQADRFLPSSVGEKPEASPIAGGPKRHYHDVLLVDTAGRLAIDMKLL